MRNADCGLLMKTPGESLNSPGVSNNPLSAFRIRDSPRLYVPHLHRVVHQFLLKDSPSTEESRLHSPLRNSQDLRYLGVSQPLDVAQHDGGTVVLRQIVDLACDFLVDERIIELALRVRFADRLVGRPSLGIFRKLNLARVDAALPADEGVIQDREQPRAGVGAELVLLPAVEGAE